MRELPILVIDFENIPKLESVKTTKYSKIILFLSKNASKITIPDSFCNKMIDFSIYKVDTVGKNNLDFHIVHFISDYLARTQSPKYIFLMSKDKGYDGVIKTINNQYGNICTRIKDKNNISNIKSLPTEKKRLTEKEIKIVIQKIENIFLGKERHKPSNKRKLFNWVSNWVNFNYKKITKEDEIILVSILEKKGFLNRE